MTAGGLAAVEVRGLRVVRSGRTVLHDLSFSLPEGVVVGLLGPSGCGKTTLLRSLVGVQRVAGGSVTVAGLPAGSPALRRRIGYLTQAPSVYADLSVRENLRYFAVIAGVSSARAQAVIDDVDLRAEQDALVSRLSGGQRARVSLAVALLAEPPLLVLDEPTVGLDPVLRAELWARFHDLAGNGSTLLVSSHVMDEAERCSRLLLMRDGRLLADGSPAELRERTGTASVEAAFLRLVGAG